MLDYQDNTVVKDYQPLFQLFWISSAQRSCPAVPQRKGRDRTWEFPLRWRSCRSYWEHRDRSREVWNPHPGDIPEPVLCSGVTLLEQMSHCEPLQPHPLWDPVISAKCKKTCRQIFVQGTWTSRAELTLRDSRECGRLWLPLFSPVLCWECLSAHKPHWEFTTAVPRRLCCLGEKTTQWWKYLYKAFVFFSVSHPGVHPH